MKPWSALRAGAVLATALALLPGCDVCGQFDITGVASGDLLGMTEECGRRGSWGYQFPEHGRGQLLLVPEASGDPGDATYEEVLATNPSMTLDFPLEGLDREARYGIEDLAGDGDIWLTGQEIRIIVPLTAGFVEFGRSKESSLGDRKYRVTWDLEWAGGSGITFTSSGEDWIEIRETVLPSEPPFSSAGIPN